MPVVTVTGAGGFVGSTLVRTLSETGHRVRAVIRRPPPSPLAGVEYFECRDIADIGGWNGALEGADAVVHLVACPHVEDNAEIAHACVAHSVGRLVYLSSVKVNGEATGARPFTADDLPSPTREPYARNKREIEAALFRIGRETGLEVTAIRPPLVYGPGVKGNFLSMMRAVSKQWPLPFALVSNARSLVSVFNLCDLIKVCLTHPAAAGEVFLVCDGEDPATPELIRLLAAAMRREARLVPCPVGCLRLAGVLLGRSDKIARLCGDLRVDMSKTRRMLGWEPPLTLAEGIERTVRAFV